MTEKTYTETQIRTAVEKWVSDYQEATDEEKLTEYGELDPVLCANYLLWELENGE